MPWIIFTRVGVFGDSTPQLPCLTVTQDDVIKETPIEVSDFIAHEALDVCSPSCGVEVDAPESSEEPKEEQSQENSKPDTTITSAGIHGDDDSGRVGKGTASNAFYGDAAKPAEPVKAAEPAKKKPKGGRKRGK